jgi:hypothetical protein
MSESSDGFACKDGGRTALQAERVSWLPEREYKVATGQPPLRKSQRSVNFRGLIFSPAANYRRKLITEE